MKIKFFFLISILLFISGCKNYPELKNSHLLKNLISNHSDVNLQCLYSVPKNYTPSKSYPLIVVLHGLGGNAEAFAEIWKPTADSLGFVLLSVQGEKSISDAGHYAWGKNAEKHILLAIDLLKNKVNIDQSNISIAGFSAGGNLAAYLGFKYPLQIKGIVALSARIREEYYNKSLVNDLNRIYIGCGTDEKEYTEMSLIAEEKLSSRGVKVSNNIFKDLGHDIPKPWNITISNILNFLNQ